MNSTNLKNRWRRGSSTKYQNAVLFSPGADSAQGVSEVRSFRLSEPTLYDNLVFPSETAEKLYTLSPFFPPLSKAFVILCTLFFPDLVIEEIISLPFFPFFSANFLTTKHHPEKVGKEYKRRLHFCKKWLIFVLAWGTWLPQVYSQEKMLEMA